MYIHVQHTHVRTRISYTCTRCNGFHHFLVFGSTLYFPVLRQISVFSHFHSALSCYPTVFFLAVLYGAGILDYDSEGERGRREGERERERERVRGRG